MSRSQQDDLIQPARHWRVASYLFRHHPHTVGYVALVRQSDQIPLVFFGPVRDAKSEFVADACAKAKALPDTCVSYIPSGCPPEGLHTAIVDEKGRPWALFGLRDDLEGQIHAGELAQHPVFQDAVRQARRTELPLGPGSQPIRPKHIQAIIDKEQPLTDADRLTMAEWIDRHWADALQDL